MRRSSLITIAICVLLGATGIGCSKDGGGSPKTQATVVLEYGMIGTLTGDGIQGGAGEVGKALTESRYYNPMELSFVNGTLYIVDWNNHRIRRLKSDNTVETIMGSELGFPGDWPCQN